MCPNEGVLLYVNQFQVCQAQNYEEADGRSHSAMGKWTCCPINHPYFDLALPDGKHCRHELYRVHGVATAILWEVSLPMADDRQSADFSTGGMPGPWTGKLLLRLTMVPSLCSRG